MTEDVAKELGVMIKLNRHHTQHVLRPPGHRNVLAILGYVVFECEAREPHFDPSFTHVTHELEGEARELQSHHSLIYHIHSLLTMRLDCDENSNTNTGTRTWTKTQKLAHRFGITR